MAESNKMKDMPVNKLMVQMGIPMILSIVGTVGTRILWIYVFFPQHRSLSFLFISYPASWFATIVLQVICYYFTKKNVRKKMIN